MYAYTVIPLDPFFNQSTTGRWRVLLTTSVFIYVNGIPELKLPNYNYYSIYFFLRQRPTFTTITVPPFLRSSVPPFLPTCDVGRLQRAPSLGYPRSSVQQQSHCHRVIQGRSPRWWLGSFCILPRCFWKKSSANTLLIFSTKMDSAPLHLSRIKIHETSCENLEHDWTKFSSPTWLKVWWSDRKVKDDKMRLTERSSKSSSGTSVSHVNGETNRRVSCHQTPWTICAMKWSDMTWSLNWNIAKKSSNDRKRDILMYFKRIFRLQCIILSGCGKVGLGSDRKYEDISPWRSTTHKPKLKIIPTTKQDRKITRSFSADFARRDEQSVQWLHIVVAWRLATFSRDLQVAKKKHWPSSWSNTPHLKVGRTGHKRWFPGEEAERSLEGNP